jgi:hypothetical protein
MFKSLLFSPLLFWKVVNVHSSLMMCSWLLATKSTIIRPLFVVVSCHAVDLELLSVSIKFRSFGECKYLYYAFKVDVYCRVVVHIYAGCIKFFVLLYFQENGVCLNIEVLEERLCCCKMIAALLLPSPYEYVLYFFRLLLFSLGKGTVLELTLCQYFL